MEGKSIKHSYVVHLFDDSLKSGVLFQFTDDTEVCIAYSPDEDMWTDIDKEYYKFYISDSVAHEQITIYALGGETKFSVDYNTIEEQTKYNPYQMDKEYMMQYVYDYYQDVLEDMGLLP